MIFFHVFLHSQKKQYLLGMNMFRKYRYLYCVIWGKYKFPIRVGINKRVIKSTGVPVKVQRKSGIIVSLLFLFFL